MKILVIPDTHGTKEWKLAKNHIDNVDKVVFLGDYVDHWTIKFDKQMSELKQIINFKKKYTDKVVLLWGNHDTSYYLDEQCSGFQEKYAYDFSEVFRLNEKLFDVIYICDKWVFAHGGVSKNWMSRTCNRNPCMINQLFKERPRFFRWVGPDSYGNNLTEGPLWIRPGALKKTALDGYNFCVGHSELKSDTYKTPSEIMHDNGGKILLIDSPKHDMLIILDTETGTWEMLNENDTNWW